jgi:hypothetical protein
MVDTIVLFEPSETTMMATIERSQLLHCHLK